MCVRVFDRLFAVLFELLCRCLATKPKHEKQTKQFKQPWFRVLLALDYCCPVCVLFDLFL